MGAVSRNLTRPTALLGLDGEPLDSPPAPRNSPFKAPRSNARSFSYLGLALFYVLHFTAVKKSRQRDTFALVGDREVVSLSSRCRSDSPTCRGARMGGRKQSRQALGAPTALLFEEVVSIQDQQNQTLNQHDGGHACDGKH